MSWRGRGIPPTAGVLRALAHDGTSPAVERALGVLLGADVDATASVVDRLMEAGRLGQGLLAPVLVLAARRGADAAGAIADLAAGRPLPEGWSAYELRAAADEAADDLRSVLRSSPAGHGSVLAAGPDAPATVAKAIRRRAASTVLCGAVAAHLEDGLALPRAVVDHAMVTRLAAGAGLTVGERRLEADGGDIDALLVAAPDTTPVPQSWLEGLDEVVQRDPEHLGLG